MFTNLCLQLCSSIGRRWRSPRFLVQWTRRHAGRPTEARMAQQLAGYCHGSGGRPDPHPSPSFWKREIPELQMHRLQVSVASGAYQCSRVTLACFAGARIKVFMWRKPWSMCSLAASLTLLLKRSQSKRQLTGRTLSINYQLSSVITCSGTVLEDTCAFWLDNNWYISLKHSLSISCSSRGFLSADSVHPVKLVQDFLHKGLTEKWSVHMAADSVPFLLTAQRLQTCSTHGAESTHWYWIHLDEEELSTDTLDSSSDKLDRLRTREGEEAASKGESAIYVLRPSLLPQIEELFTEKEEHVHRAGGNEEKRENDETSEGHTHVGHAGVHNCAPSLFGMSGLVFRNVPVNLWALPSFHQLVLKGIFPSEPEPITLLGQRLESLLGPYGVSLVKEREGLSLTAKPMGAVGNLLARANGEHASITVCLNLDLLAVLLFGLPDWRLLWSHDPRFLKRFALRPLPGEAFHPLSLYPEPFIFDISFWTGSMYREKKFHAVVREASCGTVERVKLIDRFSHPELSQTSYCYRLAYRSHTHALAHSHALQFHKQLECLLASRLQVTIR